MSTTIYEPDGGELQVTRYAGPTKGGPNTRYQLSQIISSSSMYVSVSVEEGATIALAILNDAVGILERRGPENFLAAYPAQQALIRKFGKLMASYKPDVKE